MSTLQISRQSGAITARLSTACKIHATQSSIINAWKPSRTCSGISASRPCRIPSIMLSWTVRPFPGSRHPWVPAHARPRRARTPARWLGGRLKNRRHSCPSRIRGRNSARLAPSHRLEARYTDDGLATGIMPRARLDQTHPVQGRKSVTAPFQGGRGGLCAIRAAAKRNFSTSGRPRPEGLAKPPPRLRDSFLSRSRGRHRRQCRLPSPFRRSGRSPVRSKDEASIMVLPERQAIGCRTRPKMRSGAVPRTLAPHILREAGARIARKIRRSTVSSLDPGQARHATLHRTHRETEEHHVPDATRTREPDCK